MKTTLPKQPLLLLFCTICLLLSPINMQPVWADAEMIPDASAAEDWSDLSEDWPAPQALEIAEEPLPETDNNPASTPEPETGTELVSTPDPQPDALELEPDLMLTDPLSTLADSPVAYCTTANQLQELSDDDTIETIVLDNDIYFSEGPLSRLGLNRTSPLTIDAGNHTIFIENKCRVQVYNGVTITGSSTVIHVTSGVFTSNNGSLILAEGDHCVAVQISRAGSFVPERWDGQPVVLARGANATGVKVDNNSDHVHGSWDESFSLIKVEGQGAVGIRASGDLEIEYLDIEAIGPGSIGIQTGGDFYGLFCSVSGEEAAIISDTGIIVLDCMIASPAPEHAHIVRRTVDYWKELLFPVYMEEGDEIPDMFAIFYYLLPLESDLHETVDLYPTLLYLEPHWDLSAVDPDTPGVYPAFGDLVPLLPIQLADLTWPIVELPVYVARNDRVQICYADDFGPNRIALTLFKEIEDADGFEILYTLDEGQTWEPLPDYTSVQDLGDRLVIEGLDGTLEYQFLIDVTGGIYHGTSNVASYPLGKSSDWSDFTVPRDGTERETPDSGRRSRKNSSPMTTDIALEPFVETPEEVTELPAEDMPELPHDDQAQSAEQDPSTESSQTVSSSDTDRLLGSVGESPSAPVARTRNPNAPRTESVQSALLPITEFLTPNEEGSAPRQAATAPQTTAAEPDSPAAIDEPTSASPFSPATGIAALTLTGIAALIVSRYRKGKAKS